MKKFSVIVTTYNQSLYDILITLRSIVSQDLDDFEIIIADDCSCNFPQNQIREFFDALGFSSYRLIINEKNLATVRNLLHALEYASGRYIKWIGAGDTLYEPQTLSKMFAFCQDGDKDIAFGKIRLYAKQDGAISVGEFPVPISREYYIENTDKDCLLEKALTKGDWIPGGSIFFKRDFILRYLPTLANDYGVKYCEDLVSILVSLDQTIPFFDEYTLWYEWGVGISTGTSLSSTARTYNDIFSFYQNLCRIHPQLKCAKVAFRRFKIKRFIILRLPALYALAKKSIDSKRVASLSDSSICDSISFLQDSLKSKG